MKKIFFLVFSVVVLLIDVVLVIYYPHLKAIRMFIQFVLCSRLLSYFVKINHRDNIFLTLKWMIVLAIITALLIFKVSSIHKLSDMVMTNIIYIIDVFLLVPILVDYFVKKPKADLGNR